MEKVLIYITDSISLYLAQADLRKALLTIERSRSRTLIEQLAQTRLSASAHVPSELLGEELRLLTELRRLRLALLRESDHDTYTISENISNAQQALTAVFDRMSLLAPDYAALRRPTSFTFDNLRQLLYVPA